MRIVLTGGLGFIGSHVAEKLIADGAELLVVDDGRTACWSCYPTDCLISRTCVTSEKVVDEIASFRPQCVVHLAAQVNVGFSVKEPLLDLQTNIAGTVNLLKAAQKAGVARFIFASSGGAVYGDQRCRPTSETALVSPMSPYGLSKLSAESYLNWFAAQGSMECINLRFANVYGPRQGAGGEGGVVAIFAREIIAGRTPVCFGDGRQSRDFVYVDCVARAVVKCVKKDQLSGTFNIGSGIETEVRELFSIMTQLAGGSADLVYENGKSNEVRHSSLDIARARSVLKWSPAFSLEQGCAAVLAWARARQTLRHAS